MADPKTTAPAPAAAADPVAPAVTPQAVYLPPATADHADGPDTDPLAPIPDRELLHRVLRIQVAILSELKAANAEPSAGVVIARAVGSVVVALVQGIAAQLEREIWPGWVSVRVGTVVMLLISFSLTFGRQRAWEVVQHGIAWATSQVVPPSAP